MTTSSSLRAAGIAAFAAGLGYALIPVFRAVVGAIIGSELSEFPHPSEIAANTWVGVSGAVLFAAIGVAAIVLTQSAITARPDGLGARLGSAGGVAAGIGFVLTGASSAAMYSWIAGNLMETGADEGAQTAALWAVNILAIPPLALAAVGICGWTWWLSLIGVIGRGLGVVCAILASVIVVAIVGFAFLPAQFLYVPLFVVLGIGLIRAAGRTA